MDENNNVETSVKPRSNKGLIIAIIITIILILCMLGYICYERGIIFKKDKTEDNKKSSVKKDDITEEKLSSEDESAIINLIKDNALIWLGGNVYTHEDILSEIDDKQMYACYLALSTVNRENVRNYFENVYGIEVNKFKNVVCPYDKVDMFQFDNTAQEYNENESHPGHGGIWKNLISYYLVNSSVKDDIYTLDLIALNAGSEGNYDINGKNILDELNGVCEEDGYTYEENCVKQYFIENIDKYKTSDIYRYQFKKTNNKFTLYALDLLK